MTTISLARDDAMIEAMMALVETPPPPFEPMRVFRYDDEVLLGGVFGCYTSTPYESARPIVVRSSVLA